MARKAANLLSTMEKSGTISHQALQWLTLATDPFHDGQIEPAGFPDINTVSTLVQQFTQTISIDSSGINSPTWDAHVFFAPFSPEYYSSQLSPMIPFRYTAQNQFITTPLINWLAVLQPGYNVQKVAAGTEWYGAGIASPASIAIPGIIEGGCYRIIAAAVEVVNTTPDLYKQGSVTYYRTPSHSQITSPRVSNINAFPSWAVTCESFALAPATQSAAQLYPTSRTLAAEQGYYGIATLNKNPEFLTGMGLPPVGTLAPTIQALTSATPQICFVPAGWAVQNDQPQIGSSRVLPFDVHGAVFTGLSPQTTLQVTTRYFVERIPSANDPDLLVLTRPPTPFDPVIQEIYSRVLSQLPVGCTVDENPLGEWFNDVLEMIAEFAPQVGAVFGPMGAAAGNTLAGGAKVWKAQRKPQQQVMQSVPTKMRKTQKSRKRKQKKTPNKKPPRKS